MVDFNNDTTVATPPGEVVKILVLERREQVIEALEDYYELGEGIDTDHRNSILKARIVALWFQMQAMIKRRLKDVKKGTGEDTYAEIEEKVKDAEGFEEMVDAFELLNKVVDDMGLTVIDGRLKYDRSRIEDANQKKGL